MEIYAKTAGSKRLNRFGDFCLIDNLVKTYQGTYTHDDIFDLDIVLVHNMVLLNKEMAYINSGTQIAHREANKGKK